MSTALHLRIWRVLKRAGRDFVDDECPTRAAALAYYSALSFGPMLLSALWLATLLGESAQAGIANELRAQLGPPAGDAVLTVLDNAEREVDLSSWGAVLGAGALLFSATSAFSELQSSLNRIWRVEGLALRSGAWAWIKARLLSLGMLATLVFLSITSMMLSAAMLWLLPIQSTGVVLNNLITTSVLALGFGALFRVVPDLKIPWRDVMIGGLITATLFTLGKVAIGWYIATFGVGSTFGAAGSLLALLVWVFYSALILLFGAELTFAWAVEMDRDFELPEAA